MKQWCCFLLLVMTFISCQQDQELTPRYSPELMELPNGFPDITIPSDNAFTYDRWLLGKKLFFDPVMSVDSTISCASCHQPALSFSDEVDFSVGVDNQLGTRNAPSLANVAYHPYFTREGGVPTLEMQILVPIQEHNEFNFNIVLLAERLQADSIYVQMAKTAYDRTVDAFVITRSLACFERSLLSGYSLFDQYQNYNNKKALDDAARAGMDLFFSAKTNCSSCHEGFNFTNYAFENNGLYAIYEDEGRYRLTSEETDRALFKVPSLRNIALTAPYMHDGSLKTLEEVIEHYDTGGKAHLNKSELIKSLQLSPEDKQNLKAFLLSLTDEHFVNNLNFQN